MNDDITDLLDEIAEQQARAERILMEISQRLSRTETRLVVLANVMGYGDAIVSTGKMS